MAYGLKASSCNPLMLVKQFFRKKLSFHKGLFKEHLKKQTNKQTKQNKTLREFFM